MKYLMAAMMSMMLLGQSCSATADHQPPPDFKRTWAKGDAIATSVICRDEDSILKVVNADMISMEDVLVTINDLVDEGDCVNLQRPAYFFIHSQLVEYFDFLDRPSVAVGVESPVYKGRFLGFVLAPGVWNNEKK